MVEQFLIRVGINAIALVIVTQIVPGIYFAQDDLGAVLGVATILAVVNALLKPIITFLSCPLIIVTLGLFVFVINGLMLLVTARLSGGRLAIDGWLPAVLGGIAMALVSMALELLLARFAPGRDTATG